MLDLDRLITHVIHPLFRPAVRTGQHFDPLRMCDNCRRVRETGEVPRLADNVISIFSRCFGEDGCVVCGFCGLAMLELMADGEKRGEVPACPECGAVLYILGSHFEASESRGADAEAAFVDWYRRMACLELIGLAAGLAAFSAKEADLPIDEEDLRQFFYSALTVTRLAETDECVNHFFDRVQDALRLAELSCARPRLSLAAEGSAQVKDS